MVATEATSQQQITDAQGGVDTHRVVAQSANTPISPAAARELLVMLKRDDDQ